MCLHFGICFDVDVLAPEIFSDLQKSGKLHKIDKDFFYKI